MKRDTRKVIEAYNAQRDSAKTRSIEWQFTFDTWCDKWDPYWSNRGIKADEFCMCRHGDQGEYSFNNTFIATNRENTLEYVANRDFKIMKPKTTGMKKSIYYVYNGIEYNNQDEIKDLLQVSLRTINNMVKNGSVVKYKRVKPYKLYHTSYGVYKSYADALEVIRDIEHDIVRQTLYHRFKNPIYDKYFIEEVNPESIRLN